MEDYDIDLPADVVVGWVVQAVKRGGSGLLANAWREYAAAERVVLETAGDGETDIDEVAAVGSLEVMPEHEPDSWVLKVRVADELGARLPEDEDAPDAPEAIDLDQFWEDFIAPGRGAASIWVSATGPAAKEAFDKMLAELEGGAAG